MGRTVASVGFSALLVAASVLVALPREVRATVPFVVNKTSDAADLNLADNRCDVSSARGKQCTLRAAIEQSNATAGPDAINFRIRTRSKVIRPASALPVISDEIVINGYSQPGTSANSLASGNNAVLKVVLDGVNAGPTTNGLVIDASRSTITGLVVNRFGGTGITINGDQNVVRGTFVGTNPGASAARPNAFGIWVHGNENLIGARPEDHAGHNLISGNGRAGVVLEGTNNTVVGNVIGPSRSNADLGNGYGVVVTGIENSIGAIEPAEPVANTIAFNRVGILLVSQPGLLGGSGNLVASNNITLNDQGGVGAVAGPNALADNTIANNGGDGILIERANGVVITHNLIYDNERLGINLRSNDDPLGGNGVTANDAGDVDDGANALQNFPEISSAIRGTGVNPVTTINGTLDSAPNRSYRIELFAATADPTGYGEGAAYLGTIFASTNASGHADLRTQVAQLAAGSFVTATAIDDVTGDTSEFAQSRVVVDPL